jgi:hypothetical protein
LRYCSQLSATTTITSKYFKVLTVSYYYSSIHHTSSCVAPAASAATKKRKLSMPKKRLRASVGGKASVLTRFITPKQYLPGGDKG